MRLYENNPNVVLFFIVSKSNVSFVSLPNTLASPPPQRSSSWWSYILRWAVSLKVSLSHVFHFSWYHAIKLRERCGCYHVITSNQKLSHKLTIIFFIFSCLNIFDILCLIWSFLSWFCGRKIHVINCAFM